MVPRLRQGADPESIETILKTAKAKWPRLAAKAESGSQETETRAVAPETRAPTPQTPALEPETGQQKPLSQRLMALFGGGDNPSLRMSLYIRIQLTCQTFGKPAEVVVREVCEAARRARSPGNYFAFSIVRRLRENGFIEEV